MMRAVAVRRASDAVAGEKPASGSAILQHDERHLRRRVIELSDGGKVLVDLPGTVVLEGGDALVTDDGDVIDIIAATEPLYEIHARDSLHLTELSWHLGNRHLAAAIETNRILILRDHVIRAMLEGLGARITEIMSEFQPVRGAYSGDGGHAHTHGSSHDNTVGHAAHGSANGHSHDGHAHDSHGHHHHSHDAQTHTTGPHSALDHHHD